jgi:sterol desaturase/sphingolipid hydroxylase (fatty acid hydroxylase superfamily)
MSEAKLGTRDKRGDWRPPYLLHMAPVFVWPVQPAAFLKWLFGYPGYLWPWNIAYVSLATLTWLFLTPPIADMKTFEVGWIAIIFGRNAGLLILIVSAWHLRLYVQKAQGVDFKYNGRWLAKKNPIFLFDSQLLDNVFWTLISAVPVWTAYEVVTMWAFANGFIPYVDWETYPIYCTLLMLAIPIWRDLHFYLIHRLIHWPPLYRTVHHLHHKNANPGPWSGLAMHPVEHVLYFSGVLIHWIIPSHPLHAIFHLQHLAFAPAQGHSGFDRVVIKGDVALKTHDYYHYLHHKYFECNYGGDGSVPLDQWFGTFHDGSDEAEEAMNKRFLSRTRRAA